MVVVAGLGVLKPVDPKAEVEFVEPVELGVVELNEDVPKGEGPWLANAPNAPVAGLRTLPESPDELAAPNAEPLWPLGVPNDPNILGLGASDVVESLESPNESPPNPPPPVSTSADMG